MFFDERKDNDEESGGRNRKPRRRTPAWVLDTRWLRGWEKNGQTETAVSSPTPPTWQDHRPCLLPNYERERIRRAREARFSRKGEAEGAKGGDPEGGR